MGQIETLGTVCFMARGFLLIRAACVSPKILEDIEDIEDIGEI